MFETPSDNLLKRLLSSIWRSCTEDRRSAFICVSSPILWKHKKNHLGHPKWKHAFSHQEVPQQSGSWHQQLDSMTISMVPHFHMSASRFIVKVSWKAPGDLYIEKANGIRNAMKYDLSGWFFNVKWESLPLRHRCPGMSWHHSNTSHPSCTVLDTNSAGFFTPCYQSQITIGEIKDLCNN